MLGAASDIMIRHLSGLAGPSPGQVLCVCAISGTLDSLSLLGRLRTGCSFTAVQHAFVIFPPFAYNLSLMPARAMSPKMPLAFVAVQQDPIHDCVSSPSFSAAALVVSAVSLVFCPRSPHQTPCECSLVSLVELAGRAEDCEAAAAHIVSHGHTGSRSNI